MGRRDQPRDTVLRTFRLDRDIIVGIEDIAHEKHTSPNNLVNLLLRDYIQWGFYYDARGSVRLSKRTFRSLLDHLSEQEIQALGRAMHTNTKEMALLKTGRWDLDSYLALSDASKFSSGARTELKRDGEAYTLILHHDLGPKFSTFAKSYHEAIIGQFAEDGVKTEVSDGTVVFYFKAGNHSS